MEFCNIIKEKKVCRLCGEVQQNVIKLSEDDSRDIICLVERTLGFLNIKFINNGTFPKWLCVACHLDAESAEKFLLMVEEGQRKLRLKIKERHVAIDTPSSTQLANKSYKILGAEKLQISKTSAEIKSKVKQEITLEQKTQSDPQTSTNIQSSSKYPKRVRKPRKRFPCDPIPDTEKKPKALVFEPVGVNAGTFITINPIAELHSANGSSLAEIIAVDSDVATHSTPTETDIRLICEYCKDVFTKQHTFLKHLRTHNESIYECTVCTMKFETISELKQHQKCNEHKGTTILAKTKNISNKAFQENEVSTGDKTETTINIVVDDEGHITSIDPDINSKPEEKDIDTKSSDYTVEKVEQVESALTHKTNAFQCLKCKKLYKTRYSVLRHHKQVHVGTRSYKCQHCTASFKHATNLAYHMAKHTGIRNFKCDICAKAFVHKNELTLHVRTHTGDKPYVCGHCTKAFAHRSNMVTHMRLHSGLLPFECETCGAKFNSSSHWKLHKQMHLKHAQRAINLQLNGKKGKNIITTEGNQRAVTFSTEQTFNCERSSEHTSSLLRPKHTIVKSVEILPPINSIPGPNAVISSSDLKSLILTSMPSDKIEHSVLKPLKFQCEQCMQRFKLKSALTKHLRTHTGERPYKCPLCPRSFADATNFKRHKSLHKTATEQLQNISKQYKGLNLLQEFQRDKMKSLPVVSMSPTHSAASDPDPDGLEAIGRANFISQKNVANVSDEDNTIFDDNVERGFNQNTSNDSSPSTEEINRPAVSKSPPKLVCISYPNPANPSDNKMTTFYV